MTLSFEEYMILYNTFNNVERNLLKDLKKLFTGEKATDIEKFLKSQEREEGRFLNSENGLRFFSPYFYSCCKALRYEYKDIPSCLVTRFKHNMREDDTSKKSNASPYTKETYDKLGEKEKKQIEADSLKYLAIMYARQANLYNKFKTRNNQIENSNAMTNKDIAMEQFFVYAIRYNRLVSEEHQIAFAIVKEGEDKKGGPRLDASIPGHTRMSLHFGGGGKCNYILKNVNSVLENIGQDKFFPQKSYISTRTGAKIEGVNVEDTYKMFPETERLPRFEVINTGLILSLQDDKKTEIYKKQIRGENTPLDRPMDYENVELFANFMYPDFNDREMYYIAEAAEFGKGDLIGSKDKSRKGLRGILQTRSKRREDAQKESISLREKFVKEQLEGITDPKEKLSKINELYSKYLQIKTDNEVIGLGTFIKLLNKIGIDQNIIMDFSNESYSKEETADFLYCERKGDRMYLDETLFKKFFEDGNTKDRADLIIGTMISMNKIEEMFGDDCIRKVNRLIESRAEYADIIKSTSEVLNGIYLKKTDKIMSKRIRQMWDEYSKIITVHSNEYSYSQEDVERFKKILRPLQVEEKIFNSIDFGFNVGKDGESVDLNGTSASTTSVTYQAIKKVAEGKNTNERKRAEKFEQELMQSAGKMLT